MPRYKNKAFHDALKAYTRRAIKDVLRASPPKYMSSTEWRPVGKDTFRLVRVQRMDFWELFRQDEIHKRPEYRACLDTIKDDDVINRQVDTLIGTHHLGKFRLDEQNLINTIAMGLLEGSPPTGFNNALFEKRYKQLEKYLYSNKLVNIRLTPLYGVKSFAQIPIQFDDQVSIVKLTDDEIAMILNSNLAPKRLVMPDVEHRHFLPQYAIKILYETEKLVGELPPGTQEEAAKKDKYLSGDYEQRILDCLRLLKTGTVLSSGTVSYCKLITGTIFSIEKMEYSHFFSTTSLSTREVTELVNLWKRTGKLRKDLHIALRRFGDAIARKKPDDKMIDLMIAAEALFLPESDELTYKLSMRTAYMLERSKQKRREVYSLMKDAYKIRSRIIHGATPVLPFKDRTSGQRYNMQGFTVQVEELLRRALKKALHASVDSGWPKKGPDWDSLFFGSGG
jgi:hypothetical protein